MLNVSFTPASRNDGSGSCATAFCLSSWYFTGAWLNRNVKNASVAVTLGGSGVSSRCTVVKSGAGNGAPRPPPARPACPAPPARSAPAALPPPSPPPSPPPPPPPPPPHSPPPPTLSVAQ